VAADATTVGRDRVTLAAPSTQPAVPAASRPAPLGSADVELRVLDAVLAMLVGARDRHEAGDRGAACDYTGWARDLLAQLLDSTDPGPANRHRERLAFAHRELARAACEGDAATVAEVAEFLGAVRAVRRRSSPAASSSAA
jgi:hypothetical protein